jgi:transcriptional regulator with XRE-family HTH domain
MPVRRDLVADAQRRVHAQVATIADEIRQARLLAGLSQRDVARAAGCSRQLISAIEVGRDVDVGIGRLARTAAVVGLDVSIRAFMANSALRDTAQLRLISRLQQRLAGVGWTWRTEVPVVAGDRRAFDAVMHSTGGTVAVEAITRLVDTQAQLRRIRLKQRDASVGCVILVLADTRHNRAAIPAAEPSLRPEFPLRGHAVMRALRTGTVPRANGVVLL